MHDIPIQEDGIAPLFAMRLDQGAWRDMEIHRQWAANHGADNHATPVLPVHEKGGHTGIVTIGKRDRQTDLTASDDCLVNRSGFTRGSIS